MAMIEFETIPQEARSYLTFSGLSGKDVLERSARKFCFGLYIRYP